MRKILRSFANSARATTGSSGSAKDFSNFPNIKKLQASLGDQAFNEKVFPNLGTLLDKARLTRPHLDRLAKISPPTLISQAPENKMSLEELLSYFESRGILPNETRLVFLEKPNVLELGKEFFESQDRLLEDLFGFSVEDCSYLIQNNPPSYFQSPVHLANIQKALAMLLGDDVALVKAIVQKNPIILSQDPFIIRGNLYALLDSGFTIDQVGNAILKHGRFLLKSRNNLLEIFTYLRRHYGFSRADLVAMVTGAPQILSLNFGSMFIPRLHLFKVHGLLKENIRELLITAPGAFALSIASTEAKFKYLTKIQNISLNKQSYFPKILHFPFESFIKPRGTLMLAKNRFVWDECLSLNDAEFCELIGASLEELVALKPDSPRPEFDVEISKKDKFISEEAKRKALNALVN